MALNSSTATAGTDALASEYNDLRLDAIELGGEYAVATGSGGAYAVSIDSEVTAYATGMAIKFKANHTYSGTSTINVNSIGTRNVSNVDTIINGKVYIAVYDGTNFVLFEEARAESGRTITAGEDLSEGDLVSLNDNDEAVKANRVAINLESNVSPTASVNNIVILKNTNTQAIAFYDGNIDLIEVDESDQSISIADNEADSGVIGQYGQSACEIDDNTFASVRYGGSIDITVATVAGTTITIEDTAQLVASGADSTYYSIAKIDTNKFAVCYEDGTDVIVVGCSYSGGSITVDSANQFTRTGSSTQQWVVVPYDTDEIIFVYRDDPGDDVYRQPITFSGTVPTGGSSTLMFSNDVFLQVWVSDNFVGIEEGSTDNIDYSVRGSDVWSTLGDGSFVTNPTEIEAYEGDKYTVATGDFGTSDTIYQAVLKGSVNGEISILAYNSTSIGTADLDNDKVGGGQTSFSSSSNFIHVYGMGNLERIQGVASHDVSSGDDVQVVSSGIVSGYTGLTEGNKYYYDLDDLSTLVANSGHIQIGQAVSATQMSIDIQRTPKPYRSTFVTGASTITRKSSYHFLGLYQYGVTNIGSFGNQGVFIEEGEDKFLTFDSASEAAFLGTYSYNTPNLVVIDDNNSATYYITTEYNL
jgi:hypothetical protein